MKVLILADREGWIVDRITDEMIRLMVEIEFRKEYYTKMPVKDFLAASKEVDLIHYMNSDVGWLVGAFREAAAPILLSVRSHRYPPSIKQALPSVSRVHVISPQLKDEFVGSVYIPDGIFEGFEPDHDFVVGFAGEPSMYKGFPLIQQACDELGVIFEPATNLKPSQMRRYYKGIDVLVSASVDEGFCAPVAEAMNMNVPVISTDTGIAHFLNITKCERSVEGIKEAIQKFYTHDQVKDFTWPNVCAKMKELYETCLN